MRASKPLLRKRLFAFVLPLMIVALGLASLPERTPGADEPIRRAWELAQASGRYGYDIDLRQTVTAAPSLAGAGANPQSDQHVTIRGQVDQPQRRLELTIAANGDRAPGNALGVKVENGQAFGRQGDGAWQPMEQSTDLFAPGGDPLGFLAGVDQIRDLGTETRTLGASTLSFRRYAFVFNGDGFAAFMQERLEQQLRERGALPPALSVNVGEAYRQMAGAGEIWIDEQGLPRRITLDLTLPPQAGDPLGASAVAATIRSDFFDFDYARLAQAGGSFWDSPAGWLGFRLELGAAAGRRVAPAALLVLLEILLLALAVRFWRRRRTQALMSGAMIAALLLSPLFQAQDVAAFYAEQQTAQAEQTAAQDAAAQRQQAVDSLQQPRDPHAPPSAASPQGADTLVPAAQARNAAAQTPAAPTASAGVDTDGDGLSDADEAAWGTCPSLTAGGSACAGVTRPRDSDGDNLSDGAEVNQLGTLPRLADSDGGGIL